MPWEGEERRAGQTPDALGSNVQHPKAQRSTWPVLLGGCPGVCQKSLVLSEQLFEHWSRARV